MANDLLTPEELGEKLKAGEITREEAVEIMSERARREAFATLYAPGARQAADEPSPRAPGQRARWGTWTFIVAILLLILLLLLMARN